MHTDRQANQPLANTGTPHTPLFLCASALPDASFGDSSAPRCAYRHCSAPSSSFLTSRSTASNASLFVASVSCSSEVRCS